MALPPIDVVVISHNHYDHLDRDSIVSLARQRGDPPQFLVPLGIKAWMARLGITRVVELDWWDVYRHPATVPAARMKPALAVPSVICVHR